MKKVLFLAMLWVSQIAVSQISFNTGSVEFDNNLNTINAEAKVNIAGFDATLKADYNISSKEITHLRVDVGMQPAEIYMLCEVSKLSGKSISEVETSYVKNKGKGWGVIAKEMGIKPGSAEFHAMKNKAKNKSSKGKGGNGKAKGKKK
ncbi:hypothetical protein OAH12_00720 [Cyclobacteriaceae bacterium]|nr:hypothetical protein [Cyclobacteriaceae bacterium]